MKSLLTGLVFALTAAVSTSALAYRHHGHHHHWRGYYDAPYGYTYYDPGYYRGYYPNSYYYAPSYYYARPGYAIGYRHHYRHLRRW